MDSNLSFLTIMSALFATGVFFAVCMALLVLSLAMSIFVVKLLHYSEKEVKVMSMSACLLDKYGSMDQSFIESAFTSMKTLDDMEQSGGRRENIIYLYNRVLYFEIVRNNVFTMSIHLLILTYTNTF